MGLKALYSDIDNKLNAGIVSASGINYNQMLSEAIELRQAALEQDEDSNPESVEQWLIKRLPTVWTQHYDKKLGRPNEILQFSDSFYDCLFDYDLERVVAYFGLTNPHTGKRDASRQKGFIPQFTETYQGMDRGHFMSHRQGGGMDVNFFPQRKEVNRGWSEAGKIYRKMERYCASHAGILCFSRPIYNKGNETWVPDNIEYGVMSEDQIRVVVFPN